jgi:hypothetical protein
MADPTRAPITYGRDPNFFVKLVVSNGSYATNCDVIIPFSTQTVTFQLEASGPATYSFNGTTDHGDMTSSKPSADLIFENRVISKIWFKGSGTVRIEAWAVR